MLKKILAQFLGKKNSVSHMSFEMDNLYPEKYMLFLRYIKQTNKYLTIFNLNQQLKSLRPTMLKIGLKIRKCHIRLEVILNAYKTIIYRPTVRYIHCRLIYYELLWLFY